MGCVLFIELKRVDNSKPQKYSDLRKIQQDKHGPLNPGENYYVHKLPKFPLSLKDKRYKYKEYHLDVYNLRCSCDSQKEKREEFPDRDIRRLCKHLYYKISSSWIKEYVDSLSLELTKSAALFGEKHLYKYTYKNNEIVFGFQENSPWVNVYAPNNFNPEVHHRYSFDPIKNRWSYNCKPEYAILFEDVIKRLIEHTLLFEHLSLLKRE